MKKIILLGFLILGLSVISQAQTKLISHKSHSGSKATFKTALGSNLFDMGLSDFGEPGWFDATEEIDSLVHVNDSTVYVYRRFADDSIKDWQERHDEKKWTSKTDTLLKHPLFSNKHDLHNIRHRMRRYYEFRNFENEIKFVGYDDDPEKAKQMPVYSEKEMNPNQGLSPLNIEEPKECKKPEEEEQIEIEELPKTENIKPEKKIEKELQPKKQKTSSMKSETPKAVWVSLHEEVEGQEENNMDRVMKSESNPMELFGLFGFALLMLVLSFQYFKKS